MLQNLRPAVVFKIHFHQREIVQECKINYAISSRIISTNVNIMRLQSNCLTMRMYEPNFNE